MLLAICVVAALFGVLWWRPVRRFGGRMAMLGWVATSGVAAGLGTLRVISVLRQSGSPAARRVHPSGFFALYVVTLAVILAPAALALWRRARTRPNSGWGVVAATSAGWSLLGIFLALVIALLLDFANVPFVPGISRTTS